LLTERDFLLPLPLPSLWVSKARFACLLAIDVSRAVGKEASHRQRKKDKARKGLLHFPFSFPFPKGKGKENGK